MGTSAKRADHWNAAYLTRGMEGVSWFQAEPTRSLDLIRVLEIAPSTSVIDVGGGASVLVDRLLASGFTDVTLLELSSAALKASRERIGKSDQVTWLPEDILTWKPDKHYGLWHDRAVFHFLTDPSERQRYLETMWSAIEPGGKLAIATFADDGPEYCSGLPVARYSADDLLAVLGDRFEVQETQRELHTTPAGTTQPFTWLAGRCRYE